MREGYNGNGWTNYETWCVNLWLDSEEVSQRAVREMTFDALSEADGDRTRATGRLADRLKDDLEEAMPKVEGMWADLLNAALGEVNWQEIAGASVENNLEEWRQDNQPGEEDGEE